MPRNSKSPATDYAARSADAKPNIAYPTGQVPVGGVQRRAAQDLNDIPADPTPQTVTAIDATTLRADIDAAMVAQGATACNNAGARAAIAAVVTDVLARTRTTQTVSRSVPAINVER